MGKRLVKEENGFTLLEVMISVVILAFGLLGIAALQLHAIRGNAFGDHLNQATERIETKFDQLRNVQYEDVVDENESEDSEGYTRVTEVVDVPNADMKNVTVTVSWKDQSGLKDHSISFQTIISD